MALRQQYVDDMGIDESWWIGVNNESTPRGVEVVVGDCCRRATQKSLVLSVAAEAVVLPLKCPSFFS